MLLVVVVVCATDAKKKWKADEDFEFEEVPLLLFSIIPIHSFVTHGRRECVVIVI